MPTVGGHQMWHRASAGFALPTTATSLPSRWARRRSEMDATVRENGAHTAVYVLVLQAFSARLQRGGSFLSEFGSLGSTPVELAEISRVVAIADEFLVSRFYWQYKNYKDITSSGGYSRLSARF